MNTNYNFNVVEKNLKTEDGLRVPNKAIIREDTNRVLSVMSHEYKLIKHEEVIRDFEKALAGEISDRKITLCRDGAVFFARYLTPRVKSIEIKKGDIVRFGVEVFNSYDGSLPVGFVFTAIRLVCKNGMTIPKSIARISVRHIGNPDLTNIRDGFQKRLPLYLKSSDRWSEWSNITPTEELVDTFLKYNFGKRHQKMFGDLYKQSQDKTVWGLYNVFTRYSTHDIKVRKDNLQNKRLAQWSFDQKIIDRFYNYNW